MTTKIIVFICAIILMFPALGNVVPSMVQTRSLVEPTICKIEMFKYIGNRIYVIKSEFLKSEFYVGLIVGIKPRRKRVWMEIYIAVGDQIRLHKIITAKITPAHDEEWFFEDFNINSVE